MTFCSELVLVVCRLFAVVCAVVVVVDVFVGVFY